jgi:uncharacterized RDD family membrane protein YckC
MAPVTRAPVPDEAVPVREMAASAPAPRTPAEAAQPPSAPAESVDTGSDHAESAPAPEAAAAAATEATAQVAARSATEVGEVAAPPSTEVAQVTAPQQADHAAVGPGTDPTLARSWRRLVAFVIDAAILTLVTGALWGRLLASFANRMSNAVEANSRHTRAAHGAYGRVFSNTTGPYLAVLILTIIVAITYYWLLTAYWGTTIGKRAVGTWVVTAGGRSRVSLRRSLVRALIFVLGGEVVPLFFVVDNLWLAGDRQRQALHDKVAGTLVVRTPPPPGASEDEPGRIQADDDRAGARSPVVQ